MTTHNTQREVEEPAWERLARDVEFRQHVRHWRTDDAARRAALLLTRPSVDEEFVRAARELRANTEHDGTTSGCPLCEYARAFDKADAALASVEGKPAQPTAVDERRGWWEKATLRTEHADPSKAIVPSLEIVEEMIARALERAQAKPDEVFDDQEGKGPCGGRRCFLSHARDGEWIHSGKSYGSCSVRRDRMEETVRAAYSPAPAVKGEAVASWVPSAQEIIALSWEHSKWPAFKDDPPQESALQQAEVIRQLISQRAPRVDVRRLLEDWEKIWTGRDTTFPIAQEGIEKMRACLAKQSIPTAEVEGG